MYFGVFFYLERYFAKPGEEWAISGPHPAQDISDCDIGDQLQREDSHYYHIQYTIFDTLKHKY